MVGRPAATNKEIWQQVASGSRAGMGFWCPFVGRTVLPLDGKHSAATASNHTDPALHAYTTSFPAKLISSLRAGGMFNLFFNLNTLHGAFAAWDSAHVYE